MNVVLCRDKIWHCKMNLHTLSLQNLEELGKSCCSLHEWVVHLPHEFDLGRIWLLTLDIITVYYFLIEKNPAWLCTHAFCQFNVACKLSLRRSRLHGWVSDLKSTLNDLSPMEPMSRSELVNLLRLRTSCDWSGSPLDGCYWDSGPPIPFMRQLPIMLTWLALEFHMMHLICQANKCVESLSVAQPFD